MIHGALPRGYHNAETLHKILQTTPEKELMRRGQVNALNLFREMSRRVPAYKAFLAEHQFSPDSVKDFSDFHRIPPIDKENYLRKYPKEMLCWDGDFKHKSWVISSTSGSSGEPYYFPREKIQDKQYAITAELYLRSNYSIHTQSTLYIVAFPMGAWIGGVFTYEALRMVADNGDYNLSIVTPGIHKQEVINAVKQLGKQFDQVIIGAYAPFLKDILDDGARQGINWHDYKLGFVFSAEAFTEIFRNYVLNTTGIDDPLRATLNHYGTADMGTMAHETPESIMIRRHLVESNQLQSLFPESKKQPTFAQYNPELFYFEEIDQSLYCSAYSGLPLVRYDLKDYGGVLSRDQVLERLKASDYDVVAEVQKCSITDTQWNLPYVYVYERTGLAVSYYAFLVYPDMIRRALQVPQLESDITGKFTMHVDYNLEGRQQLYVHVEMKYGVESRDELVGRITSALHDRLNEESSEYRETYTMMGAIVEPVVELLVYEDLKYFAPGTKQKWVIGKKAGL